MNHLKKAMLLAMVDSSSKMLLVDAVRIIDKYIDLLTPEERLEKERMAADDILIVAWEPFSGEFHMTDYLTQLCDEFEDI